MAGRAFCAAANFDRSLKRLEKKHRGVSENVDEYLDNCIATGPGRLSQRLKGVSGRAVYKERLPVPGMGKRGGIRVIYYCDPPEVYALLVFDRSTIEDIRPDVIKQALGQAGLLGDDEQEQTSQ